MPYSWYVTFEVKKRGCCLEGEAHEQPEFETEEQAREFARAKFNEGLMVHAGTVNPYLPRRTIPSSDIPGWLDNQLQDDLTDARGFGREEPG